LRDFAKVGKLWFPVNQEGLGMDAEQIRQLKPQLRRYLARFDDCFDRRDTRGYLPVYVEGQLSDLPRKSVEPIALKAGVPVRTLQEFLSQYRWDEDRLRDRLQALVATEHASPRSIGIIDDTSFVKKGDKTPGVHHQYCGTVGKQENCMVTVHLGYAADDFHCLLDGELFLPEKWSADRARCRAAGIADEVVYRPKTEIALELYDRARAQGIHFEWLTFDEWYGAQPPFLRALDRRQQKFVAEVHKRFGAWIERPRLTWRRYRRGRVGRFRPMPRLLAGSRQTCSVEKFLTHPILREQPWQRWRVKDGVQGPFIWEVKQTWIYPKDAAGLPDRPYHLLIARDVRKPEETKYFVSNAPPDTSVQQLLLVAFSRWRIERCFEDDKGEVGLDHYEGRRYVGLKRHLLLSAVSYLFLARVRQELAGKKSGVDGVPGPYGGGSRGAFLVAQRLRLGPALPGSRRPNPVPPSPERRRTPEPYENRSPGTPADGHQTDGHQTMQVGHNLAL
jgi:SRSO17 transposase